MSGILSASAVLDGVSEFAGMDVSGCIVCSGVSGAFAGLEELSGIVDSAGSGEIAGCNECCCERAAGDLPPLLVGREGKTGGRVIVLGRIELSPESFVEDGCLLPGCMLRVGVSDFDGFDEPDNVLFSVDAEARVTCFSGVVAAVEDASEL